MLCRLSTGEVSKEKEGSHSPGRMEDAARRPVRGDDDDDDDGDQSSGKRRRDATHRGKSDRDKSSRMTKETEGKRERGREKADEMRQERKSKKEKIHVSEAKDDSENGELSSQNFVVVYSSLK